MSDAATTPPRSGRSLRMVVLAIMGLVLIAVIALTALVLSPPQWAVRALAMRAATAITGGNLRVEGESSLTWRPGIALRFGRISLSSGSGDVRPPLLTAERAELKLNIVDLWRRQIDITELILVRPEVSIGSADPLLERWRAAGDRIGLSKSVRLTDGHVTLWDKTPADGRIFENLNAALTPTGGGKGLAAVGDVVTRGERFAFDGTVADAATLFGGPPSLAKLSLDGAAGKAAISGTLSTLPQAEITGTFEASTSAIGRLMSMLGIDAGDIRLGSTGRADGSITWSARRLALERTKVALEPVSADIRGEITFDQPTPRVTGAVAQARLDLDQILPSAPATATGLAPQSRSLPIIPSAWQSLIDALEPPQPSATGFQAQAEPLLSDAPLPISSLPLADLDVTLAADVVTFAGVPLSNGRARLTSSAGRFVLDVSEVSANAGRASGRADLQLTGGHLDADIKLKVIQFALDPFVAKVVGARIVDGTGDVDVEFKTRGRSLRQLASMLDGTGKFKADRGALVGIDLRAAVLSFGSPQSYDPGRRTPFDTLRVAVSVSDGVAQTIDPLEVSGPQARITSRGTLALVTRRLQQSVMLTLFPPPIHLPLRLQVGGTLDTPSVEWDIFAAIFQPGSFATPFTIGGPDQRMPDEARMAVMRALAADPGTSRLTPESRTFLEQLVSSR